MKKIKLLILMSFVFMIGLYKVNAMTLKPTGTGSGKRGGEISVYITLLRSEGEKEVSSLEGKFTYDKDVFELVGYNSLMEATKWLEFSSITSGTFSYANIYYNDLIGVSDKNVIRVLLKVKSDAKYGNSTISVSNPSATDENGDGVSISGESHTFKVLSDVNTLTNLTVEGGTLEFNENTTTYDMTIDSTSTNIVATKKDSGSTVSGDIGNKTLKYGKNTFKVNVKSESGVTKTYTINITRPDNRSTVNTLYSLKLSKGDIKFNANTTSYKVTVEYDVSSIKIDATLTDEKSSFVSGFEPRDFKLKVGTNNIEIRVKAENESVKTYKIAVTRKPDPNDVRSDNNYLSELKLSEGTIEFDKNELEYKVTVLNEVEKIEVTAKTEDTKAKYRINAPEKLEVGENEITVVVTAENGSTREYKIVVERKNENEVISGNNKLSSLDVHGYQLNFNSQIYEYTLKIADEDSLIISYQQEDETSDVIIKGNEKLKNGSVITVNVTAEDGNTQVYKINIQKDENNNLFMYIIIGGVVLLLLIIIIVILINSKKKNNSNKNDNLGRVEDVNDLAIKTNIIQQNTEMIYNQNQQPNVQSMQPDSSSQQMQNVQSNYYQQPLQNMQNVQQNVSNQSVQSMGQNVSSQSVLNANNINMQDGQNNNFF